MTKSDDSVSAQALHTHHIFKAQRELLEDGVRNRAFYAALRKRVTSDSVVLDIGSGTGIWAITAALLGAKKVVAVEKDTLLIRLIKNLARENRVQDKIEIIEGDSREIKLSREFDLFVSETIGNSAFDEEIVPILIDARKRFLKRDAALIPSTVSLIAAPAYLKAGSKKVPSGVPLSCNYFNSLSMNVPRLLRARSGLKLVAEPRELLRVDLETIKKPPALSNLTARWKTKNTADMNCFVTWAEATLTDGIKLSTLDTTSWSPPVYMIRPFKESKGDLEFVLEASGKNNFWSASLARGGDEERQSYSPVLALVSLNAGG
ncbi:MAG TPA: 50S ribosomal protein L11 methyltransferase [Blastocatellia bacterium]|nr:50S ribosomal protein L11 methyltransferase [Blastocatellia bacterium]